MGKVMIIEERQAMGSQLQKQLAGEFGAERVFSAGSPREAVDMLGTVNPDVVLMEAVLDGQPTLELVREISARSPAIRIAITCSFAELSQAVKAVPLGVTDYLLKPVDSALLKAKVAELSTRRQDSTVSGIVYWPYLESGLTKILKETLTIYPSHIAVAGFAPFMPENEKKRRIAAMRELLGDRVLMEQDEERLIMFMRLSLGELEAFCERFTVINPEPEFRMGVSDEMTDIDDIVTSFRQAREALKSSLFMPQIRVQTWQQCKLEQTEPTAYPYKSEARLFEAIDRSDIDLCRKTAAAFGEALLGGCGKHFEVLEGWLDRFIKNLANHCERRNHPEIELPGTDFFTESAEKLQSALERVVLDVSGALATEATHPIVGKVISIIEEHYAEEITLQSVAESLYLNHIYLSRLFHQKAGCSFKDYLIRVRMEKAKELLLDGGNTITEAAAMAGYSNANYFSNAFRAYAGCSPTEYRRSHWIG